jgi:hypothetical protein
MGDWIGSAQDAAVTDPTQATGQVSLIALLKGLLSQLQGSASQGKSEVSLAGETLGSVTTMQNAATATGAGTALSVSGFGVASVAVSGSFSATITWQGVGPDGATYTIQARNRATGAVASTATAAGLYELNTRGLTSVYANVTAYTSGAVTAKGVAQPLAAAADQVGITGSSVLYDNQQTVGTSGSPTQLPSQACSEVVLTADPTNPAGSYVYVGNATGQHTPLAPGQSITLALNNVNLAYAYGSASGLKLDILAV